VCQLLHPVTHLQGKNEASKRLHSTIKTAIIIHWFINRQFYVRLFSLQVIICFVQDNNERMQELL